MSFIDKWDGFKVSLVAVALLAGDPNLPYKITIQEEIFGKSSRFSIFQVCSQDFASATYPLRYPGSQSPTAILSISSSVNPCVRTKPQVGLVGVASMCSPFLDKIGIFHKKQWMEKQLVISSQTYSSTWTTITELY